MSMLKLTGWVEVNGHRLTPQEIETILKDSPEEVLKFGGEFFFAGHGCRARDHFGIMRGNCPKGTLICNDEVKGQINPAVPDLPLEEAIITAVGLRSDQGVCALSGGVDSTLIAHLARRECGRGVWWILMTCSRHGMRLIRWLYQSFKAAFFNLNTAGTSPLIPWLFKKVFPQHAVAGINAFLFYSRKRSISSSVNPN